MKREQMTNDQKLCVDARNSSIVVSAAAGSGKTAVLVERVINILSDSRNPVPADSIVVVTFTEAAANEMRQRIKDAMLKKLQDCPENVYLQEQSFLLSKAQISTIHSFCMNLLRNEYHRFGYKSGFSISNDDNTNLVMKTNAINEIFEEYYEKEPEIINDLISFFDPKGEEDGLIGVIFQLEKFLEALPFPEKWMAKQIEEYSRADDEFVQEKVTDLFYLEMIDLRSILDKIENNIECFSTILENDGQEALEAYSYNIENMKECLKARYNISLDNLDVFNPQLPPQPEAFTFKKSAYANGDEGSKLKNSIFYNIKKFDTEFLNFLDELKTISEDKEIVLKNIKNLFEMYTLYSKRYRDLKIEENIVTFNDLIRMTFSLLVDENGNKSEYAKLLSERFSYIVLDEFQDTDDLQDKIFSLLSKDETNLFIVGDSKQSIYRFRNANPDIFIDRKEQAVLYSDSNDKWKKIFLKKNFRSRKVILDFTNFVFSNVMKKDIGGIEYDENEALSYGAENYPEITYPETEVCILDTKSITTSNPEIEDYEAKFVAQRVKQLIDTKQPVTNKDGTLRPCRYSDIAVLLRKKKNAELFVKELEKLNIPAKFEEGFGFYIKTEIATILNLLKIIDNPLKEVEMVAVMMSPMFMFTAEEIADIRVNNPYEDFYKLLLLSDSPKVKEFLGIISELREYKACHSIESLIKKIYADTSFSCVVRVLDDGEQRVANLNTFLQKVIEYETKFTGGLSEFVRYVDKLKSKSNEKTVLYASNDDAVSIVTMHKSKGLEYPICIVAELNSSFNEDDYTKNQCLFSVKNGLGLKIRDREKVQYYQSVPYKILAKREAIALRGEEMRLLYVAFTRAKEKLILSFSASRNALIDHNNKFTKDQIAKVRNMSQWVLLALSTIDKTKKLIDDFVDGKIVSFDKKIDNMQIRMITYVGDSSDACVDSEKEEFAYTATPDMSIASKIVANVNAEYKYKQLSDLPSKVSVTELVHGKNAGMMIFKEPSFMNNGQLTGAQIGTAHHKFMQYADFTADVKEEIKRLENEGKFSSDEAKCLSIKKLEKVMTTSVIKRIINSSKVWREYEFISEIKAIEYNPAVKEEFSDAKISMQGVADCVFEEQDGIVLVDYKTDRVETINELKDKYKKQLELYTKPIEMALGKKVKERIILSVSLGEEITV